MRPSKRFRSKGPGQRQDSDPVERFRPNKYKSMSTIRPTNDNRNKQHRWAAFVEYDAR
jgi:hypothetical protein